MKKHFITFIFLAILTLSLYGCAKKTDQELLMEFVNTFEVDENLKTSYTYENNTITLDIVSDNEDIFSNDGTINYSFEEEIVTLSITFNLNDASFTKDFEYISEANSEKIFEEAFNNLEIPSSTNADLELKNTVKYAKYSMSVTYTSKTLDVMSNSGVITLSNTDKVAKLTAKIKYKSFQEEKTFEITVLKVDQTEFETELKKLITSNEVKDNLNLQTNIVFQNKDVALTWQSSNQQLLDNKGNVTIPNEKQSVNLTVTSSIGYAYTFELSIMPLDDEILINRALKEIEIPVKLSSSVILPTELSYGVTCSWKSSDPTIITNTGKYVSSNTNYKEITLTATLKKGTTTMTQEYKVTCAHEEHMFIDRTFEGTKVNVHIENNKLVLDDNQTTGSYETGIIETNKFSQAVGSYSATSSKNATCELLVSIRVNGNWSKYLSYGKWGLGLENKTKDTSDSVGKIQTDEIKPVNGEADAFKLKINLNRDSTNYESPKVALIALALNFSNYTFNVSTANLPKEVHYDIENLYQGDVPGIGDSICSATSTTMLLNYKGHSFKGLADYEHEYMAYIVRDYGAQIFGNWSYNTIAMGAYGENSYVKRFYSLEEIMHHLATVGPIAASVKGTVISNVRTYNTGGHLLVVSGYKVENGQVSLYIDDPNVRSTNVIMTSANFLNVYRNTSYIVE